MVVNASARIQPGSLWLLMRSRVAALISNCEDWSTAFCTLHHVPVPVSVSVGADGVEMGEVIQTHGRMGDPQESGVVLIVFNPMAIED